MIAFFDHLKLETTGGTDAEWKLGIRLVSLVEDQSGQD